MYPNCQSCHEGCLVKHETSGYRFTLFCTNPRCHLYYENNSSYFGPKTPMPSGTNYTTTALIVIGALIAFYLFVLTIMKALQK
jgi:hypothetical protein